MLIRPPFSPCEHLVPPACSPRLHAVAVTRAHARQCRGGTTMDETRAEQFTGRVLTDTAAAATVVMAALGDRLGLFRQLAQAGPATSGELAGRAALSERYVREWLAGLYAAGY